jgi:hypothetical protein
MNSLFLRLSKSDFVKGFVVAILSAGLGAIAPAIAAGTIISTAVLQGAGQAGLAGGIAYLMKNLVTNSEGKMFTSEPGK